MVRIHAGAKKGEREGEVKMDNLDVLNNTFFLKKEPVLRKRKNVPQ